MQRREFLQSTLALGATAMLPGTGLAANNGLPASAAIPAVEPLMPIWEAAVNGHWNIVEQWLRRDPSLIAMTDTIKFLDHDTS